MSSHADSINHYWSSISSSCFSSIGLFLSRYHQPFFRHWFFFFSFYLFIFLLFILTFKNLYFYILEVSIVIFLFLYFYFSTYPVVGALSTSTPLFASPSAAPYTGNKIKQHPMIGLQFWSSVLDSLPLHCQVLLSNPV